LTNASSSTNCRADAERPNFVTQDWYTHQNCNIFVLADRLPSATWATYGKATNHPNNQQNKYQYDPEIRVVVNNMHALVLVGMKVLKPVCSEHCA
jgi:hypothetical protein